MLRRIARLGLALCFEVAILRITESWLRTARTSPAAERLLRLDWLLLRIGRQGRQEKNRGRRQNIPHDRLRCALHTAPICIEAMREAETLLPVLGPATRAPAGRF